MAVKAKLRSNARKVSFRFSLQWPGNIINSVDKTKSSETDRSEISITFCTALIELNCNGKKNNDPSCLRDLLLFFLVFMANFKIFRDHYVRTSSKLTLPSERSLSLSTSLLYFVVIQTKTCQAQAHVARINLAITSQKKKTTSARNRKRRGQDLKETK